MAGIAMGGKCTVHSPVSLREGVKVKPWYGANCQRKERKEKFLLMEN